MFQRCWPEETDRLQKPSKRKVSENFSGFLEPWARERLFEHPVLLIKYQLLVLEY